MAESRDDQNRCDGWIPGLLALASMLFACWLLRYVLLPFAGAAALAYVVNPIIRWTQRTWRWPRWAGAGAIFVIVLAALSAAGWAIDREFLPELSTLTNSLPAMLGQFLRTLFGGDVIHLLGESWPIDSIVTQSQTALHHYASDPQKLLELAGITIGVGIGITLALFLLLFFMLEAPRLARGAIWMTPPPLRERVLNIAHNAGPMINRYIVGICVITIYATLLTWLVTRFVLHLRGAFFIALAVGLLELIPVIGPILSLVLLGFAAVTHASFWMIVGISLFAIVLRLSIDQLVGPIVFGKAVDLPASVILLAFLAGGAIYGPLGVFLAIPTAAVVKIALTEIYREADDHPKLPAESVSAGK